ncbi:hypothetical protein [Pseudomonas subflava]|uniref:hypothetical protein n=1 Tax=Pseudomonas subflava TaxID=2952933 RepID=UPI0020792104|nr:hypothetical protein [Pseudomonas subflava]
MNTSLRVNEALLIAGRAFQPYQCVAWLPQVGGELNLAVVDRTNNRVGQACIASQTYLDPARLADALVRSREQISRQGYTLDPWSMPE